jgi:hypothetical protein
MIPSRNRATASGGQSITAARPDLLVVNSRACGSASARGSARLERGHHLEISFFSQPLSSSSTARMRASQVSIHSAWAMITPLASRSL